jgi:hypothetical protein
MQPFSCQHLARSGVTGHVGALHPLLLPVPFDFGHTPGSYQYYFNLFIASTIKDGDTYIPCAPT